MKIVQIFLILLCLLFLAGTGYSQRMKMILGMGTGTVEPPEILREKAKEASKDSYRRSYWDHRGTETTDILAACLGDPKLRAELSISDEYYQKVLASERNARDDAMRRVRDNPEFQQAWQEYEEARQTYLQALGISPHAAMATPIIDTRRLDEEGLKALNRSKELAKRMGSMLEEFDAEVEQRTADAISNAITPEVKQKFLEMQLVGMMLWGETSLSGILPSNFEALDLTDTQKQQIERIKKELGPEFERCIELRIEESSLRVDKENAAMMRSIKPGGPGDEDPEDRRKRILEATKEVDNDPEWQKIFEESQSSTKAFAVLFKTRMVSILTDEQRKRLQDLIDNPPPHVRLNVQRGREMLGLSTGASEEGASKRADGDKDVWSPGPDSWKPGDPLPEWFRQEENTGRGFPRGD